MRWTSNLLKEKQTLSRFLLFISHTVAHVEHNDERECVHKINNIIVNLSKKKFHVLKSRKIFTIPSSKHLK